MRGRVRLSVFALGLFAACESDRVSNPALPGAEVIPGQNAAFACDSATAEHSRGLRRLTMTQYRNTVRDLVHWALPDSADADAVVELARLDELPADRREPMPEDPHGSYRRLDQTLEQLHVDGAFRVATSLATALTEQSRLAAVVGACAADADAANDAQCFSDFVRRFGARVLRRAPDAEDESFFRSVYGADARALPRAYADVITVMLSSPDFLYFVEHGERAVDGMPGVYELGAYELASRLSYHFWQTLPDAELWAAAARRFPARPGGLRARGRAAGGRRSRALYAGRILRRLVEGRGVARARCARRRPAVCRFRGRPICRIRPCERP